MCSGANSNGSSLPHSLHGTERFPLKTSSAMICVARAMSSLLKGLRFASCRSFLARSSSGALILVAHTFLFA